MWKNPVFTGVLAGMPTKLMHEFESFTTMKIPFSDGNAFFVYMNAPFTYMNALNIVISGAMKDAFGANAYQNGLDIAINVPNLYAKTATSHGNGAFLYMTGPNSVVKRPLMDVFASFISMNGLFSIMKIVAELSIDDGKLRFEACFPCHGFCQMVLEIGWGLSAIL